MAKKPNLKEQSLIDKIQADLKKFKTSVREGSDIYPCFDRSKGADAVFQDDARQVAQLMKEQGEARTCPALRSVAIEVAKLDALFTNGNHLGFAFERALQQKPGAGPANGNPFVIKTAVPRRK